MDVNKVTETFLKKDEKKRSFLQFMLLCGLNTR